MKLVEAGYAMEAVGTLLTPELQQSSPVGLFLSPALLPGASAALESPLQGPSCRSKEQRGKPPAAGPPPPSCPVWSTAIVSLSWALFPGFPQSLVE